MSIAAKIRPLTGAIIGITMVSGAGAVMGAEAFCPKGSAPDPAVIWCDGFEDADLGPRGTVAENYHEFNSNGGVFARTTKDSIEGKYSMLQRWKKGGISAGHFMRHFGRNPAGTQSHGKQDFQEIYWRLYVKHPSTFQGLPDKVSRATSYGTSQRAQSMIAHIWKSTRTHGLLNMDPATGIDSSGRLVTTKWNDFPNLRWLGGRDGKTKIQPGKWHCIEAHVKLNTPGKSDGIFEFWVDNNLEARRADLNWRGTWTAYGINMVSVESYWNNTSPVEQERYIDAFVISTKRIGCIDAVTKPAAPRELIAR